MGKRMICYDKHRVYKKDAIRIVTKAAKDYRDNLEGKNYVFVFRERTDNSVRFLSHCFCPVTFSTYLVWSYWLIVERLGRRHCCFMKNVLQTNYLKVKSGLERMGPQEMCRR